VGQQEGEEGPRIPASDVSLLDALLDDVALIDLRSLRSSRDQNSARVCFRANVV
jgi:hypothetical protein